VYLSDHDVVTCVFADDRKYRVSSRPQRVFPGLVRQPGARWLPVYTPFISVSAAAHAPRAAVSLCRPAAEVGNAVGSGFPAPPDVATRCRISMYVECSAFISFVHLLSLVFH